jgi:hypothetical protein
MTTFKLCKPYMCTNVDLLNNEPTSCHVDVDFLDDGNLSLTAKGLLAYLGFHGKECFTVEELTKFSPDPVEVVQSAISELISAGHIEK